MGILSNFWSKITQTNALARCSGDFEILFFESIYRVTYAAGLSTADRSISYLIYSSIVKLMIAMFMFGEVWFVFSEFHSLELDDIATFVNVFALQMITVYKVKNMMDHKDVYRRLAISMESPYFDTSTDKRRELVKFWAVTHERYLKLLLALGNCTVVAWLLYPLVDELDYNLMVAIRLPFNYNTPRRYTFTYLIAGITFNYICHFVMVTDLIMQTHLVPLVCQLTVLADCFVNIIEDCRDGISDCTHELAKNKNFTAKYLKRLGTLIEQHKLILTNTMDLRAILSGPLLGQLGVSGTVICFVGYQATTKLKATYTATYTNVSWRLALDVASVHLSTRTLEKTIAENVTKGLMSLFFLGYNMFGLYIICLWCEEITVQSQNIGEAVYCSGWETGLSTLPGVRATIMLVITRANEPLVFSAGGMYNLSLMAYTNLVKTSYSAFTVLLGFQNK